MNPSLTRRVHLRGANEIHQRMKWTPEKIKALRKTLGLTQKELADKLGYKRRETIAEFEAGKYEPNTQVCIILDLLDKQ